MKTRPADANPSWPDPPPARFLGIDVGAETVKVVELIRRAGVLKTGRCLCVEHGKQPGEQLREILAELDWPSVTGAAITGRLSRLFQLPRVPTKQAQVRAYRHHFGAEPGTVISVGSHGFSVLELRGPERELYRENSRCSQGTGNFLRQLTERFSLTVDAASEISADVTDPAPLSGRCPVILKTDMTHLANKGEDRARILAGLFDAVCANVLSLIKPRVSPSPVYLIGGVSRSRRVRRQIQAFLAENGMEFRELSEREAVFFEALGGALVAAEPADPPVAMPPLAQLLQAETETSLETLPSLARSLGKVRRWPPPGAADPGAGPRVLVLGFDIGSTGSKVVAWDLEREEVVWQAYRRTAGDPVGAAQDLWRRLTNSPARLWPVVAVGVTGSGREIVGSLLMTCYGRDVVFVMNEIVAHAEGALHYDRKVDTIFEIGGQDAKYIRLTEGRVIDCAMNEACSAGTGSFIEEQGRKFAGLEDVTQLGQAALEAPLGVSLGQHCSVFMAEVIDEAVAAGVDQRAIIAGLYDSIVQNYLNRVKGSRSVGQVIFCQGMPFASDALAAAVVRQTGSDVVIPPDPGTVGALGIALLTVRELGLGGAARTLGQAHSASAPGIGPGLGGANAPLDAARFLESRVEQKRTFICQATVGCGGVGNHCRIDSLQTTSASRRQVFNWGGACALYDKGTRKVKLPDRAPDPFREREALAHQLAGTGAAAGKGRRVAISDEFMLRGLFPFFATFLRELGFDLDCVTGADQETLKRGIQEATVPFCAPMQLFHGVASQMAQGTADYLFLPMLRSLPRVGDEPRSKTCPIVQASPDLVRWGLGLAHSPRVIATVIDIDPGNLASPAFRASCQRLAADLGIHDDRWLRAVAAGVAVQDRFDRECLAIGERALAFCAAHEVVPVVVLGRPYTIYNKVLNSNVPAILREQGALALPIDCYPIAPDAPVYPEMYWGQGQRILRAAHQVRQTPGVYAIYASNYSCGPDSFNLHFCNYLMEGKPFAVIETDGHSGDAGTKTRVEAFLHCVREDRRADPPAQAPHDFARLVSARTDSADIRARGERLLIPRMGYVSELVAACFRGLGLKAECLPMPDREALRYGRRHTSGKECLPMCVTLGSLLQRVERATDPDERFSLLMPRALGPCRFGMYNLLDQVVLERLGLQDRVRIWSPSEAGYFENLPPGFGLLLFSGMAGSDLLHEARLDARAVEKSPGAADAIHARFHAELLRLAEQHATGDLSLPASLWQVASGRLFDVRALLQRAAEEFAAVRTDRRVPTVLVVGEIYVRLDPFSNGYLVDQLEARGMRVRLAPCSEWMEYVSHCNQEESRPFQVGPRLTAWIERRILALAHSTVGRVLGWSQRSRIASVLDAARPYVRDALAGEAVLTVGAPLHEWRAQQIDAVVSVGPLECMPNKIAEAQFGHMAEHEGLLSLTLSLNGEPIAPDLLDNFAFEVHARFRRKQASRDDAPAPGPSSEGRPPFSDWAEGSGQTAPESSCQPRSRSQTGLSATPAGSG